MREREAALTGIKPFYQEIYSSIKQKPIPGIAV